MGISGSTLLLWLCLATHGVQIQSGDTMLAGDLRLPDEQAPHPALIILHGGSNRVEAHRSTSDYYANRFIPHGYAVLVYDKRGTGESGGVYEESTYDDFVNDALSAVSFLRERGEIDRERIGLLGLSQGGRIAALAAARDSAVAFVVSLSAPFTPIAETRLYGLENGFRESGATDSLMNAVIPLWRQHHAALARGDSTQLDEIATVAATFAEEVDSYYLPPARDKLHEVTVLAPFYNSMGRDYVTELSRVRVPWLIVYGEGDLASPVRASVDVIRERMTARGHTAYEIKIIPQASHGFRHLETNEYILVEDMVIEWLEGVLRGR